MHEISLSWRKKKLSERPFYIKTKAEIQLFYEDRMQGAFNPTATEDV